MYGTTSNGHDQTQLQEDLQRLADWEGSWDTGFHPAKCQTLSITRSRKLLQPSYILHGHTLENISLANYLGVTINSTASWDDHISNTCAKANKVLRFFRRNLNISASNIKEKLKKLSFAHCWSMLRRSGTPTHKRTSPRLKQSRGERHAYVPQPVQEHPECQRNAGGIRLAFSGATTPDLQTVDALQNPEWPCTLPHPKNQTGPPPITSTHDKQFTLLTTRTQYRGYSFLPKTTRDWNSLPMEVVEAPTMTLSCHGSLSN